MILDEKALKKHFINDCVVECLNCSDPKQSVKRLFDFFKSHLSLDFLTMTVHYGQAHTSHHRFHATDENVVFIGDVIQFSEATRKHANALFTGQMRTHYIKDGLAHPLVKEFDKYVGINDSASIIMQIIPLGPDIHATFNIVTWGTARYTQDHIRRVESLAEPLGSILKFVYIPMLQTEEPGHKEKNTTGENRELEIIGKNGGLRDTILLADMVSKLTTPVLLIGESGVGKEMVANRIHYRSGSSGYPFVCVNCGAIPETLIDSELFGYEKGAFTGAGNTRKGYFEQADGGTILLDEISELSMAAQVKLLRVLHNKSFHRVGGEKSIFVNIRVIAASNRELEEMVDAGKFRNDLWFRLNTFPIRIPPLRKRKQDILPLMHHFARTISLEMSLPYKYRFSKGAIEQLTEYAWPGNVRELKNTVEHAMIICRGKPISFEFLHNERTRTRTRKSSLKAERPEDRLLTMDEMTVRHIERVLLHTKGQIEGKKGAAEILNMNPSTLRSRMRKLNIHTKKVFIS